MSIPATLLSFPFSFWVSVYFSLLVLICTVGFLTDDISRRRKKGAQSIYRILSFVLYVFVKSDTIDSEGGSHILLLQKARRSQENVLSMC